MSRKARLILFLVVICLILVAAGYLISQHSTFLGEQEPVSSSTPKYSLVDAAEQGIVSTEFRGRGYCSGDAIRLKVKSEVEFEIEIEIEPGWVLINSGSGQNMIVAEERTVTVKPKVELQITIEAYCLDIDRGNPSSAETLSLQTDPGGYSAEAAELMRFVKTAPEERRSISAVQIALWVLLGDVTRIPITHSETDVLDAKWLLENIGMDVSGRRIFQIIGKSEEEILEMVEAEYAASATTVSRVLTTEDFEITVTKMGVFSRYTGSDFEGAFRVDLEVKNIGNETEYFSVSGTTLTTTEGLSYERSYHGTFTSVNIAGGETKEGYLLFDEVPETATIAKLVIDEIYIFDFEKNETYTLMEMYEEEYASSATTVNMVLTSEDFEITVIKMGMFSRHTYGGFERMFRVDLKVKNIGSDTKSFSVYDTCVVTTAGLQYERSYYGTFEGGDISAGATKQGYLLFDDVPETANIAKLVIYEIYVFDFEKDEAYTLMEMYENMYQQSAIIVQQTITKGDFSITLVEVGHFTHLKYDTWGDEITEFRADFIVTSIASEPEYIFESDFVIVDNLGNQYDYVYRGTLDLGQIYPGVTREGYLLFPALNENATRITVIVTDMVYPEDIVYEFTVNL